MVPNFRKTKFADRGKDAEDAVHKFLKAWQGENPNREANRLLDTKAAGRIVRAAPADFEFFDGVHTLPSPVFGLIEVKETEHNFRLARAKLPQLPHLRKRAKCGGMCLVVINHSVSREWRVVDAGWLMANGDKGSWNLISVPAYPTASEALIAFDDTVFG